METNQFNSPEIKTQAAAAGFASVEQYIQNLLDRDADRLAIQNGLDALEAKNSRSFEKFDQEFRAKNGLASRE